MLSPFHNCRKVCYHIKSDLRKLFVQPGKEVHLLEFAGCHVHSATNVLPGLTTFVACCSKPTNERISGDPLQYDLPCSTDPETDLLLKKYKDLFGTIPGFQGRP